MFFFFFFYQFFDLLYFIYISHLKLRVWVNSVDEKSESVLEKNVKRICWMIKFDF